jgi:hypothetical protein
MNLLALVPLPYRLLAFAMLALALVAYGYVEGLRRGESELTAYRASVELAAAEQQQAAVRVIFHQKEVTDHVSQDYEQRLAGLRARFAGMQHAAADIGPVPAVAAGSPGADGTGAESATACPAGFVENAAEDALKIQAFQEWVQRQKLPVE